MATERVNTRIRQATVEDEQDIVYMVTRFLDTTPYGSVLTGDAEAVTNLITYALTHGIIYLGQVEGRNGAWATVAVIAGLAVIHPWTGERYAEELAWWVNPAHSQGSTSWAHRRRDGRLGTRLLGAFEDWARQNACQMIKLQAPEGSRVGRLYARLAYNPIETAYVKRL